MSRGLISLLAFVTAVGCSSTPPAQSPAPARDAMAAQVLFRGPPNAPPLAQELGLATGSLDDTAMAR